MERVIKNFNSASRSAPGGVRNSWLWKWGMGWMSEGPFLLLVMAESLLEDAARYVERKT